uniref:Cadmium/zinc-transporting ATPase HMA2 n=1 Tax=Anthurium amnicola TaxID=1678845 RepID=A0A1D1Y1N1_9ARAE
MTALMSMAPQKAVLADTGEVVDANDVQVDTVLAVKAGEVIPIDGVVVEGRSEVDESSLTGESFPVPKQPQSQVWAGTLNINGYISVKTTALAENSAVAKMTKLVEEAQNSKSRTQRLIDDCAKYYTPAVVLVAALLAVVPFAMKVHNVRYWLRLSLVLLVSACPCALVLSTPVATFCALTTAAKTGLLVKGGDFLEALGKTKVVAFDKTGTITRGEFTVMDFWPIAKDISMRSLLYWVSSIESKSSHPMAAALTEYARSNSVEPKSDDVNEFHIYPGEGIYGEIDGKPIHIGNQRIATRAGCATVPDVGNDMKGVTVGYVFSGAAPIGVFSLSDTCRTGVAEAIGGLRDMGIKTAMLTGDSNASAMFAQNQLGNALDMVHAELLPEDKVSLVRYLKTKEGSTVMVGDGMNDAPALAMADVGISMGISGSAVAMETSHITLMSNDVRKIPEAIRLGRKTQHKIIQNIVMSVVAKVAILALAFAGHPLLWAAILSDVGTCLLVIFNSMLLLKADHAGHHHVHTASDSALPSVPASEKCCSSGGGCGTHDGAGEARAMGKCSTHVAHHHEHDCCPSREPAAVCHDDHGHHHDHVHDQGSHSIAITGEAGHHESCCIDPAPAHWTAAEEEQHSAQERERLVSENTITSSKRYEIEPVVCTATCRHSHHTCREFRKRPVAACCERRDACCAGVTGCSPPPQLKEIITE